MLHYLTAGESHGKGLTAILAGIPSNLKLSAQIIDHELKRRQQGYGRGDRMKIESDSVAIGAGVHHGKTLGSPISFWIPNKDFEKWEDEMACEYLPGFSSNKTMTVPRPGHADLAGALKFNQKDMRNILERASARETTARVAIGAVCKKFLNEFDIQVTGHVINIGGIAIGTDRPGFLQIQKTQEIDSCRCIDSRVSKKMMAKIDAAKKSGDSVGGIFEIVFTGLPVGLGSHTQWDQKLDGRLAQTLLSIQGIKGVEFGMGFKTAQQTGSKVHDPIFYNKSSHLFKHRSNHAGGIEGGMTNGEDVIIRAVMKPIATLMNPLASVDILSKKNQPASVERADVCAVPSACVIAENCLCFDMANAFLQKFGGNSIEETKRNFNGYLKYLKSF